MFDTVTPTIPFQNPGGGGQTPNPWFTIANQFVPRNLHDVIKWVRYITLQSPTTSEVVRKLATYPITEFIVESGKGDAKQKYEPMFKNLRLKEHLQNIGFEYFTLGNSFLSIYFPITRSLVCPTCNTAHNAKQAYWATFKQYNFHGTCPKCGSTGIFTRVDSKSTNQKDINLIRWNPENIAVNHNPITGEYDYYYKIPNQVKNKIKMGDRLFVDTVPWEIVECVRHNKDFRFDRGRLFHLKNVTTGGSIDGVAIPPLISLFSLVFYQATLRKANEAVATEYLNPLRVLFPQAQTGNSDPVMSMSLKNFVGNMEEIVKRQKVDKNYVAISPVPVGYSAIGGEGKNLLVSQEIQQAEDSILLSLGVSRELLSGTTNWTSSSVGLRMMENLLFSYIGRLQELIDWVVESVAVYCGYEVLPVKLEPFKLLDDTDYKQMLVNLVGANGQEGLISKTTLFEALGIDYAKELEKKCEEAAEEAANVLKTKYEIEKAQIVAARGIGDDFRSNDEYKQILTRAQALAQSLAQFDPQTQQNYLQELKINNYAMYMISKQILEESTAAIQPQVDANGQPIQGQQDTSAQPGQPGQSAPQESSSESGTDSSGTEATSAPKAV